MTIKIILETSLVLIMTISALGIAADINYNKNLLAVLLILPLIVVLVLENIISSQATSIMLGMLLGFFMSKVKGQLYAKENLK